MLCHCRSVMKNQNEFNGNFFSRQSHSCLGTYVNGTHLSRFNLFAYHREACYCLILFHFSFFELTYFSDIYSNTRWLPFFACSFTSVVPHFVFFCFSIYWSHHRFFLFFFCHTLLGIKKNHKTRHPFKIHVLWPQMKSAWNVSCLGKHTQYTERKAIRDREGQQEIKGGNNKFDWHLPRSNM